MQKIKSIALIFVLATGLILAGCNKQADTFTLPEQSLVVGLASPVTVNPDTTVVYIADYFPTQPKIDSVKAPAAFKVQQNPEIITLIAISNNIPKLGNLEVFTDSTRYDIMLKSSGKMKVPFSFKSNKNYQKVQLKGEFNGWNPNATSLQKNGDQWETTLTLAPGEYQYLIVADGKEMLDPNKEDSVSNNIGGYNSLLEVGKYKNLQKPHLYAKSTNNGHVSIGYENDITNYFVLGQNKILPNSLVELNNNELNITVPEALKHKKRTYIRVFASNDDGISNSVRIPLDKGRIMLDADKLTRTDFEAATIYNVFTDRFNDGNPDNTWKIDDESIHPKANYFGGDIEGIIEKINDGYFSNLGINTLWVSPLVKNPEEAYGMYPNPKTRFSGYHGYWPVSFTQLNPHFGTEEDLKRLVETAHANDMNVLLDFVANHVHEDHPVIKANPDWKTNLYLPDGSLNTENWDSHRLTTWFDTFMPTLDLTKPEVTNMLTDSAVYWIKEYNLDGFRHDATKHVPEIFWRTLTQKLRKEVVIPENRRLYQIGETYGSPELIGGYVNSGQLNAQFDFNVYDALVATLASDKGFEALVNEIHKSLKYYGAQHIMGNITGNQDRARFISYASDALSFDEDAKKAGWTREIKVENPVGYEKLEMLNSIVATIPGLPVIYYGDEIGMVGGNDPDNRRMMRFNNLKKEEQEVKKATAGLLNFRQKALPLIFGDFKVLHLENNQLVYQRRYFDEVVIVALNDSKELVSIKFDDPFSKKQTDYYTLRESEYKKEKGEIHLNIPPYSYEVVTNVKQ